jgi:hypothetical protein
MKRRSKKLHWIKYYPSDWQAEPTLRTCSLASKGLWIEMLGLMAHSVRHGYLCKMNSLDPMPPEDLAKFIAQPLDEIMRLLQELEGNGVFSRTCDGLIYSRRLLKDAKARKRNCKYTFKRRQNETITHSPHAISKYVRSVSDERLETKDQNKENRDQRTQTEITKRNAEMYKPTAHTQSISEKALEVKGLVNGLVGGKVVPKHTRPSVEQFMSWGKKLGLNEGLLEKDHARLQGRNWLDSNEQPINDVFTYLNSVSARLRKEG